MLTEYWEEAPARTPDSLPSTSALPVWAGQDDRVEFGNTPDDELRCVIGNYADRTVMQRCRVWLAGTETRDEICKLAKCTVLRSDSGEAVVGSDLRIFVDEPLDISGTWVEVASTENLWEWCGARDLQVFVWEARSVALDFSPGEHLRRPRVPRPEREVQIPWPTAAADAQAPPLSLWWNQLLNAAKSEIDEELHALEVCTEKLWSAQDRFSDEGSSSLEELAVAMKLFLGSLVRLRKLGAKAIVLAAEKRRAASVTFGPWTVAGGSSVGADAASPPVDPL